MKFAVGLLLFTIPCSFGTRLIPSLFWIFRRLVHAETVCNSLYADVVNYPPDYVANLTGLIAQDILTTAFLDTNLAKYYTGSVLAGAKDYVNDPAARAILLVPYYSLHLKLLIRTITQNILSTLFWDVTVLHLFYRPLLLPSIFHIGLV